MTKNEDQGFQTIGDLTSKIVNSLSQRGLTQTKFLPNSETTGLASQAPKGSSSTGRALSEIPAATLPDCLRGSDPEATDRALLALLPPSVASSIERKDREWVDPEYGLDFEISHYAITAEIPDQDRRAAYELVEQAMAPATAPEAAKALARLRLMTVSRREGDGDLALLAAAYTDEATEYPPDVVSYACRAWVKNGKWWPAWAELRETMERAVKPRRALLEALGRTR